MFSFLLLFIVVLTILALRFVHPFWQFLLELRRRREFGERIYGPPGNWLLGNIADFPKCRFEWVEFLIRSSNDALAQGHSLIRWWAGWKLAVWTLDAETARVLLEHTTELRKGRDYDFFKQWLGQGLLLSDGQKWREQRKLLTPCFHFSMLLEYMGVFNRQAKILVQRLALLEDQPQQDISPMLTHCTLDIIGETTMGVHLHSQTDGSLEYVNAVARFNFLGHIFTTNIHYSMFQAIWALTRWGKETRQHVRTLKEFTQKVINERINGRRTDKNDADANVVPKQKGRRGKAFLDLLLQLEADGQLTREEMREQTDTFMFEGHDTTSHALGWIIWCLACHPECQQQARLECQQQQLEGHMEEDNNIDVASVNELRYLDMCVREALRLFPSVPVVERDLQEDLWIGDKLVPRGTMVLVSPMTLHHSEKVYPRHWEFDPENFLPEKQATRNSFDFIPFSAGPRNCIGQKFALLELKVVLAHILRQFHFSTDVPFRTNRPGLEAILKPKLGIPVRITRAAADFVPTGGTGNEWQQQH